AECNAPMLDVRGIESQEILVLRENDPARGHAVGDVCLVLGPEKAGVGGRRYVDAVQAKASGNGRVAMLIQVESNRPCHGPPWPRGASGASTRGPWPSSPRQIALLPGSPPGSRPCGRSNRQGPHGPGRG